jgi:hypothetical protein
MADTDGSDSQSGSRTVRGVVRAAYPHLVVVAFVLYLPLAVVGTVLERVLDNSQVSLLIRGMVLVAGLYWLQAVHAVEVAHLARESPEAIHERARRHSAFTEIRERFRSLLIGEVLIALAFLAVVFGLTLVYGSKGVGGLVEDGGAYGWLLLVGFFLFLPVMVSLMPTIIVIERWGPIRSFGRMLRCMEPFKFDDGAWTLALVTFGLAIGVYYAIRGVFQAVLPSWTASFFADIISDPLTAPLIAILWAKLYLDIRNNLSAPAEPNPERSPGGEARKRDEA